MRTGKYCFYKKSTVDDYIILMSGVVHFRT